MSTGQSECIVEPEEIDGLNQTTVASATHYRKIKDLQMQIECQIKVEKWRPQVNDAWLK